MTPKDPSELVLVDEDGKARIILSASRKASVLSIVGEDGAALMIEAIGARVIIRMIRSGGSDAAIVSASEESASVVLNDGDGRPRVVMHADLPDLSGEISISDKSMRAVRVVPFP